MAVSRKISYATSLWLLSFLWFLSAANGDEDAKKFKAEVAEEMTKEQIAEAQKLSREMIEANLSLIESRKLHGVV